jgi:hypothetical protein
VEKLVAKTNQILIDVHDAAALKDAAKWMHPDLYAQVKARAAELQKTPTTPGIHNILWHGIPAVGVRIVAGD